MAAARFATLDEWLGWQERLHPKSIDLGLERLYPVLTALGWQQVPFTVITVGGTNGKGSSVAFLEAILRAAGYRVGAYTSPHLYRYNERVRVDGIEADDSRLCQTFERIDRVRGDTTLTYFEFGTLAALEIFREAEVDVAVLEVGLGGRLDAVNVLDADVALITSIGLDHTDWLGPDRDSIGWEKAGIFRAGRPAVCADPDPPNRLLAYAEQIAAPLHRLGTDYHYRSEKQGWQWQNGDTVYTDLPYPYLIGAHQLQNAAGVLMALMLVTDRLPISESALRQGLIEARLPGRFEQVSGTVDWGFDVTHNGHGAERLAACLEAQPCQGQTRAVVAMLADKPVEPVAQALVSQIDRWYTAALTGTRGRTGEQLAEALQQGGISAPVQVFATVSEACRFAAAEAAPGDRIVVFGSFYTVAAARAADTVGRGKLG